MQRRFGLFCIHALLATLFGQIAFFTSRSPTGLLFSNCPTSNSASAAHSRSSQNKDDKLTAKDILTSLSTRQGRSEVRRPPGQEASLAPTCSNLRSFGTECTGIEESACDIIGTFRCPHSHLAPFTVIRRPHSDSAPGELYHLAPRSLRSCHQGLPLANWGLTSIPSLGKHFWLNAGVERFHPLSSSSSTPLESRCLDEEIPTTSRKYHLAFLTSSLSVPVSEMMYLFPFTRLWQIAVHAWFILHPKIKHSALYLFASPDA